MSDPIEPVDFPDTPWSLLAQQAAADDPDTGAIEALLALYWQPVFCAIRDGWGKNADEAGVLCERFLIIVLAAEHIRAAVSANRFRTYLKQALSEFMGESPATQVAGGRCSIQIDTSVAAVIADGAPESVFDHSWTEVVYAKALERTREQFTQDSAHLSAFISLDVEGNNDAGAEPPESLREVRMTFRRELTELVYQYVSNVEEARDELRWLLS